jgi:hypothetical protein
VGTPSGLVASDVALGDLTGDDGVPEVAVGRLPVLDPQALVDYVAKIASWESVPPGAWPNAVLMAADNPDPAGSFTTDLTPSPRSCRPEHPVDKVPDQLHFRRGPSG